MAGDGCRVPVVGCRLSGAVMAVIDAVPGTGSGTDPGPALPWPTGQNPLYMHSSHLVQCAHLVLALTPRTPGTPLAPHRPAPPSVLPLLLRGAVPEAPWGSLRAAPVDRLAAHVPWPVNTGALLPLIGTHSHAPCVTQPRAITASTVNSTLPWSTL